MGGCGVAVAVAVMCSSGVASADPVAPPEDEQPVHKFLALGIGLGGLSRHGDVAPMEGTATTIQFGQRLRQGLHLVEEFDTLGPTRASLDSPVDEAHVALMIGVRWMPFGARARSMRRSPLSPYPGHQVAFTALYLRGSVGLDLRDRYGGPVEQTAYAPIATAALGYLAMQGHDWAVGPEVREQVVHYSDGNQRGWALLLIAQVSD